MDDGQTTLASQSQVVNRKHPCSYNRTVKPKWQGPGLGSALALAFWCWNPHADFQLDGPCPRHGEPHESTKFIGVNESAVCERHVQSSNQAEGGTNVSSVAPSAGYNLTARMVGVCCSVKITLSNKHQTGQTACSRKQN